MLKNRIVFKYTPMKTHLFYIIGIIVIILYSINSCDNKNAELKIKDSNILALKDSTVYFKNKLGQTVATKRALQLTQQELKQEKKTNKNLKIALEKFKKPIVVVQTKQVVRIDTILIPYKDTIPFVFNRFEKVIEKDYSFDLTSTNLGNTISNLKLTPNNQTFVVGEKKNSIFKNAELRVDITNSNPLFNQIEVKPIVIIYKKSFYEKPLITIPIGFVLGLLVN